MPTRLSRFCDALMEASWLAALILVPVFYDIYSSRIFEPDKITLLRSLSLVILSAWLIKLLEEGGVRWERIRPGQNILQSVRQTPLAIPVLALTLAYILSTLFSVSPRTSFWGSYQRLQGTYTTISYLVIFVALIANMRRREQVDRLILTLILASLPVSLYGVLQRYRLDPIPWGGNTSVRVAANLGNSIFVAAYLIMVFPLTIGRIVESFNAILKDQNRLFAHVARATVYIFIASLQVITIYFSGSRGPALGWMAGVYFLTLLLSLNWRKRWMTFSVIGLAVVGAAFLLVFNIPGGPLDRLKGSSLIGRFGSLLDEGSNTAKVRKYIWQGTVKLVSPHAPIQFPDGSQDRFNFLRPLIGYGPESMYVAYNPFYVPELGHVERRNASPDRSHNETWDSIVITGFFGFLIYLAIFLSFFYYGFKWLGLINGSRQKILFLVLSLGGGILGAIVLSLWRGVEYLGVGLPFGLAMGLLIYLAFAALIGSKETAITPGQANRSLILIVLVSAVIGHFLEINFGIAIAATRTYFWVFSALLLAVGFILPKCGEYDMPEKPVDQTQSEPAIVDPQRPTTKNPRGKRRKADRTLQSHRNLSHPWLRQAIISGILLAILISTLGFDYIKNDDRLTKPLEILWNALTVLPNRNHMVAYSILALVFTAWVACAIALTSENNLAGDLKTWSRSLGVTIGIAGLASLVFWLWHANSLANLAVISPTTQEELISQVDQIGGLLTNYYVYLFLLLLTMAYFLVIDWPTEIFSPRGIGIISTPVLLILIVFLVYATNIRVIQADITFKMTDPFARSDQWSIASILYNHAIEQAPNEDYYYLFLGRANLEEAKANQDPTAQEVLVRQAENDLKTAQKINPLNTDHTANLARLYSWWASQAKDSSTRQQRGDIASEYFTHTMALSPNNSTLWGEWAILYLNVLSQPEKARPLLERALELDDGYNFTQGLMADYYMDISRTITDTVARKAALEKASEYYQAAADLSGGQTKVSYLIPLSNAYAELAGSSTGTADPQWLQKAIDALNSSIQANPNQSDLYRIHEQIARFYALMGDKENAMLHLQVAVASAPEDQQQRLKELQMQISSLP